MCFVGVNIFHTRVSDNLRHSISREVETVTGADQE